VLELYHSINSVCAQKVRIALVEKRQEAKDHIMALRGDQYDPAYLKLNPNGVVPTLVHDGVPLTESALILYYIDDAFPEPPLMPKEPQARHRVRMYNKLIDEYVHNSCTILTFATAFRPAFLKMPPGGVASRDRENAAQAARGLQAQRDRARTRFRVPGQRAGAAQQALGMDGRLAGRQSLPGGGRFLQRGVRSHSLYPAAGTPEARRTMGSLPVIADWWARMRARPSVKAAIFDRMSETDWAPFKNLAPDPWPKVQALLKAA